MSREIKFRSWDTHQKKMHQVDQITIGKSSWHVDYGFFGVSIPYQPHIEIMQFTGLKDKNGKEWWEGDIIGADDGSLAVIEYHAPHFVKVWNGKDVGLPIDSVDLDWYTVVGNRFENPDLIAQEDTA